MSVLPHDAYGRDKGIFIGDHLPYVPSINIAGTVAKLGLGVTKYKIGQRIFGEGTPLVPKPDQAGLQEYATLRVAHTALIPDGFTEDQVATIPCNAVTAFSAMFNKKHLALPFPRSETFDYASRTLVVVGGGSNVGRYILQLAKLVGLGKVVAIASMSREKELKALGATHVVDRFSGDVLGDVYDVVGGKDGVTDIIDTVSWTYELAAEMIRTTGVATIVALHKAPNLAGDLENLKKSQVRSDFVLGVPEFF